MAVSNYDPRLLELWRDGGTTGVELKLKKNDAIALRQRLYRLRADMKAEAHAWSDTAERASISLFFGPPGSEPAPYSSDRSLKLTCDRLKWDQNALEWKLSIQPPDDRFDEVLDKLGYKLPEPPPLPE